MSRFEWFIGGAGPGPGTMAILAGSAVALVLATVARWVAFRRRPEPGLGERWRGLGTWWALLVLLAVVLLLGRPAVAVAAAAVSVLLLREVLALTGSERLFPLALASAAIVHIWAWLDWTSLFLRAFPVFAAILAMAAPLATWSGGGLARWRTRFLPALSAVFGPSFLVAVASLPAPEGRPREELGWLVLLLVLTELNDIAQAWWGWTFGSRPMAPILSPDKTWEGLVGGLGTTVVAASLLAPLVTSYGRMSPLAGDAAAPAWAWSVGIGLLVGLAGVAGDLWASWIKRRAGVKDAGRLLPGQGGVLDRFDSLILSAPVFFFATWLLWFARP